MKLPFSFPIALSLTTITFLSCFISLPLKPQALGSASTIAVTSAAVCGIVAAKPVQRIKCYHKTTGEIINIQPEISFSAISGGESFFCGLTTGGSTLLCWNTLNSSFNPKRVYFSSNSPLQSLAVGGDHICGILNDTAAVKCWRGNYYSTGNHSPAGSDRFASISSGYGFSCGILMERRRIRCWGTNPIAAEIESRFGEISMASIEAGGSHVCGISLRGFVVCKGENDAGQLDIPANPPWMYNQLGVGANHGCGIRIDGSVVCWGGRGKYSVEGIEGMSFELVVSGWNFSCGLVTRDLSVICWGPGWVVNGSDSGVENIPFSDQILPGPCVESECEGGLYPDSDRLCFGSGNVCYPSSPILTFNEN